MREIGSPTVILRRTAGSPDEIAQNRERVQIALESALEKQSGFQTKIRIFWTKKLKAEEKANQPQ